MARRTSIGRRWGFWIAAPSVLVLAWGAWVTMRPAAEPDVDAATVRMTDDLRFDPRTVRVRPGGTVTWTNTSSVVHTVTSNAGTFDSGEVAPGSRFTRTFAATGTYGYVCTPHRASGMAGTVVVEE